MASLPVSAFLRSELHWRVHGAGDVFFYVNSLILGGLIAARPWD